MACLPDGRSRREGFPLLGQHRQAGFYAEFENNLLVEPGPDLAAALGQDLPADDPADLRVRALGGAAGEGEAAGLPGGGGAAGVRPGWADDRADRVPPRAAVGTAGGQEARAGAVLVEVLAR